jgi:hypothetical protein
MYYILKFRIDRKKNSGTFYGAPAGCGIMNLLSLAALSMGTMRPEIAEDTIATIFNYITILIGLIIGKRLIILSEYWAPVKIRQIR